MTDKINKMNEIPKEKLEEVSGGKLDVNPRPNNVGGTCAVPDETPGNGNILPSNH